MALDKKAVIGETLDEVKVQRFLEMQASTGENADFHALQKAYRGLPADAFNAFVELFLQAGRDINAKGANGATFLQSIEKNTAHPEYAAILRQHGAS
ncbi:MAG TPA: PA4642 family protein [Pseudomonadales bacterium]|nr:PA4642 family protein [Pseudomonadales bacterium]